MKNTWNAFLRRNGVRQLMWVAVAFLLIAAVAVNQRPVGQQSLTPVPGGKTTLAVQTTVTATISPLVIEQNNETNGIILGGVILVLIILGGTLQVLRPRPNE